MKRPLFDSFSARDAGILRIGFFSLLFFSINVDRLMLFSGPQISQLHLECPSTMGVFFPVELSLTAATAIGWVLRVSLVMAAAGLFATWAYFGAFTSLTLLNLNALKYCASNHDLMPIHIALMLWFLLDTDSSYRLSNVVNLSQSRPSRLRSESASTLFFALRLHFVFAFFASGLSKLRIGGIDWMTSDSLRNILIVQNYAYEAFWLTPLFRELNGMVIAAPLLCNFIAVATVGVELLAPMAFYSNRLRRIIIPELALMQIGILVTMYIGFYSWAALYLCWMFQPLRLEPRDNQLLRFWITVLKKMRIQKIVQESETGDQRHP